MEKNKNRERLNVECSKKPGKSNKDINDVNRKITEVFNVIYLIEQSITLH